MRKSSVGSAVLGLLAVTVASIGATGVLMLLPFPNDRALFGCAGAITAVLYFGYGRWIGSRQSAKVAGLVMILAAAVQVLWLVVLYGAVPEWLLGIAGCALPFAALVDGGTGSRELLALVAKLSDEFDVEITPLMIVPENFQSAQAMWQMIEKLQDE